MNVHISYKVHKTADIDKEINHFVAKLNRRLRVFRPELVHLKGLIEDGSPREGTIVSLNLRLPSGQMAARETAPDASAALKAAFDDLVQQIGKHKDLLRRSHQWRRRGGTDSADADSRQMQRPFEQPGSPIRPIAASREEIRSYVNTHLGRLQRFVDRELRFREIGGQMTPDSVTKEEVVDEVVLRALGEVAEETQSLALEPWLYRLAIQSINDLIFRSSQGSSSLPDSSANGDSELEFHQPDEFISGSDLIADRGTPTPEDIAYIDELISMVQFALGDTSRGEQEIFILHALEGFSISEISAITERTPEEIRSSVSAAREKLRRLAPISNGFKEKHLQQTSTD